MLLSEYLQMSTEERNKMFEEDYQNMINENGMADTHNLVINPLHDAQLVKSTTEKQNIIMNGNLVNKNPITEIFDAEMRLYSILGTYFGTREELEIYCQNNGYSMADASTLDYLRSFAGRNDVIKETCRNGRCIFYTVIDEDGYAIYNQERSVYKGEHIWEYCYGKINNMYSEFRDRGITFTNDIYGKINEESTMLLKRIKDDN